MAVVIYGMIPLVISLNFGVKFCCNLGVKEHKNCPRPMNKVGISMSSPNSTCRETLLVRRSALNAPSFAGLVK